MRILNMTLFLYVGLISTNLLKVGEILVNENCFV